MNDSVKAESEVPFDATLRTGFFPEPHEVNLFPEVSKEAGKHISFCVQTHRGGLQRLGVFDRGAYVSWLRRELERYGE